MSELPFSHSHGIAAPHYQASQGIDYGPEKSACTLKALTNLETPVQQVVLFFNAPLRTIRSLITDFDKRQVETRGRLRGVCWSFWCRATA